MRASFSEGGRMPAGAGPFLRYAGKTLRCIRMEGMALSTSGSHEGDCGSFRHKKGLPRKGLSHIRAVRSPTGAYEVGAFFLFNGARPGRIGPAVCFCRSFPCVGLKGFVHALRVLSSCMGASPDGMKALTETGSPARWGRDCRLVMGCRRRNQSAKGSRRARKWVMPGTGGS